MVHGHPGGSTALENSSRDPPLSKVYHPSSCKDYRPITLTSLLVKSLEQIIKTHH
ncbi:hypothetical protein FQN60_008963 [Etheostoma spectabile]|uniref:Uncharacterized protein n=1 Tax=Etheostoma spectabile TaxID=54343 RepID=A0A5J5CN83_9PERO|nr:hypothetical protein FQN60_008963 [Etheostoma spectabile]